MKKLTLSLIAAVIATAAHAGPQVDVINLTGNEAQAANPTENHADRL
jgi:hypothetical protein